MGKTVTLLRMMLYDKLKNPRVSGKDIMYRHARTGACYPIYTGSGANAPMYTEKAEITPLLYQYTGLCIKKALQPCGKSRWTAKPLFSCRVFYQRSTLSVSSPLTQQALF